MMLKAVRQITGSWGTVGPGAVFHTSDEDAHYLLGKGLAEVVHSPVVKMQAPPENKMMPAPKTKATPKPKPKRRVTRRKKK